MSVGDLMGAFYRPFVPSQTRCFALVVTKSFRGARPPRAPLNLTTEQKPLLSYGKQTAIFNTTF